MDEKMVQAALACAAETQSRVHDIVSASPGRKWFCKIHEVLLEEEAPDAG